MIKSQKIWFWAGVSLLIIPEILWSPITNVAWSFIRYSNNSIPLRDNWLMNTGNINWLSLVLFLQFIGAVLLSYTIFVGLKGFKRAVLSFVSIVIVLVTLLLFASSLSLRTIGF